MTKLGQPYCDRECYDLALAMRDLMRRVSESSKRDTLTLAQKVIIKDVAHVLDAQSRKLLEIPESVCKHEPGPHGVFTMDEYTEASKL